MKHLYCKNPKCLNEFDYKGKKKKEADRIICPKCGYKYPLWKMKIENNLENKQISKLEFCKSCGEELKDRDKNRWTKKFLDSKLCLGCFRIEESEDDPESTKYLDIEQFKKERELRRVKNNFKNDNPIQVKEVEEKQIIEKIPTLQAASEIRENSTNKDGVQSHPFKQPPGLEKSTPKEKSESSEIAEKKEIIKPERIIRNLAKKVSIKEIPFTKPTKVIPFEELAAIKRQHEFATGS